MLAACSLQLEALSMGKLKQGSKAPVFKGVDQNGAMISLADYKGKRVVLYFYPKDDTPTCTVQACNLRDHYGVLVKKGFQVIGVSKDDVKSHKKFETKHALPFPLLADTTGKIVEQYEVWQEKKFMGRVYMGIVRTTFLIDELGKIKKIINKPNSKSHTEEILQAWEDA